MKNKLRSLFLLVLCLVIGGSAPGVSAQDGNRRADKILVAGNPPLRQSEVDKLIEFYEWAFEARFTTDERERYRAFVIEGFRQDAAASRKNTDVMIQVLSKMRAKDAAAQAKMREMFNEGFVRDLRASNDEGSNLLLGIYERGQNRDDDGDNDEVSSNRKTVDDVSKPTRGGAGSSDLVGKWSRGAGSGFVDYTGKTRYKAGETFTFEFFADGTVEYSYDSDVLSIVQCRTTEHAKARGTYSVSGDQLTMKLGAMTSVGTSSCEAKNNFKKTEPASNVTKKFTVKPMDSITRPDNPLLLCFDGANGETCFEKNGK